jgi:hypothetical protein
MIQRQIASQGLDSPVAWIDVMMQPLQSSVYSVLGIVG